MVTLELNRRHAPVKAMHLEPDDMHVHALLDLAEPALMHQEADLIEAFVMRSVRRCNSIHSQANLEVRSR